LLFDVRLTFCLLRPDVWAAKDSRAYCCL
jgi:hypothetical protein